MRCVVYDTNDLHKTAPNWLRGVAVKQYGGRIPSVSELDPGIIPESSGDKLGAFS